MRKQFPACKKIEDSSYYSSLRWGSSRHHKHKELSETAAASEAASIPKRKEEGARAPKLRPILDLAVPYCSSLPNQYESLPCRAGSFLACNWWPLCTFKMAAGFHALSLACLNWRASDVTSARVGTWALGCKEDARHYRHFRHFSSHSIWIKRRRNRIGTSNTATDEIQKLMQVAFSSASSTAINPNEVLQYESSSEEKSKGNTFNELPSNFICKA